MTAPPWLANAFPDLASIRILAQGGQKIVFTAHDPAHGNVVLKIIKPGQDLERVRREVLAVQQVNSPRVPRVFATGAVDLPHGPALWIREQLISGQSVRAVVSKAPLAGDAVARMALQVLEALAASEAVQIVHRDVKPDNLIQDGSGDFWLLDFGIARHLAMTSLTDTHALGGPGTIGYAPPEQFRNLKRDLDSRADLFALAVTLVECLTGKHPYREGARDAQEVLRRIESSPLLVPRIAGKSGNRFGELIATMGQRRVDCRPPSAADALAWAHEILGP